MRGSIPIIWSVAAIYPILMIASALISEDGFFSAKENPLELIKCDTFCGLLTDDNRAKRGYRHDEKRGTLSCLCHNGGIIEIVAIVRTLPRHPTGKNSNVKVPARLFIPKSMMQSEKERLEESVSTGTNLDQ